MPRNGSPGVICDQSRPGGPLADLQSLGVKIFADGADLAGIEQMNAQPFIAGFTTNPTLMRKAGICDYRAFAMDVLSIVRDKPVSFEVFADDFAEMERQAMEIASWGRNVFVKIPVTNTRREPSTKLIRRLASVRVQQNVTAIMTARQVEEVSAALGGSTASFISIFAGRIADTGCDPLPIVSSAVECASRFNSQRIIWASPREVLNIFHADAVGCHVITVTHDLLAKLNLIGKDLNDYSQETVQMFYDDARRAGYSLSQPKRAVA